jgi:chemotaxis protein MotB
MNEQQNPFAERAGASESLKPWPFSILAGGLVALLAAGFMGWHAFQRQAKTLDRLRAELEADRAMAARSQAESAELSNKLAGTQAQSADLRDKLTISLARISELQAERDQAVQTHKGLEEEMRAELESKDVTISQLQGKLTVNILDRILFDSGEAVLKSGGETVLQKIAGILAQHPTLKIHVIGHTDNVPIRASTRTRFTSNWELSTARALAAVRFLTEKAGVDPHRVGAVGYGEFRPIADNSTAEGRARNRRIAITILGDELAGADTVVSVKTNTPSEVPPVAR